MLYQCENLNSLTFCSKQSYSWVLGLSTNVYAGPVTGRVLQMNYESVYFAVRNLSMTWFIRRCI